MQKSAASFRDPGGFVFEDNGTVYRQVNRTYAGLYDRLMESGLYAELTARRWMVPHEETGLPAPEPAGAFKVIRPRRIPFISHPYEWCFSQLRDAALLTLDIQELALRHGLSLKDATAFNIQFDGPRPVHIDTLSFEPADTGPAWIAYRQFCQHFLAPLALMSWRDPGLSRLLALHLDGVPLDLCCRLLPRRAFWNFHRWVHLWLHNLGQRHARAVKTAAPASLQQRLALVDSLRTAVQSIRPPRIASHWSQYEAARPSYSAESRASKETLVQEMIASVRPRLAWDLGCNTGTFSRIASAQQACTVATDYDHDCIEALYRQLRREEPAPGILPLVVDLTNPTPPTGWAGTERASLLQRGPADLVLALAVVHHWTLGNNVPLGLVVDFLAGCTRHLVIEFVPKSDPMSRRLLASRADIFPDYDRANFELLLAAKFTIKRMVDLPGSERVLYLCQNLATLD